MKRLITLLILIISSQIITAQYKLKIQLNNGEIKSGYYGTKSDYLFSLTSPEKHTINEIKELTYYYEKDSTQLYIIDTKTYLDSKKSRKNVAIKKYESDKIELYYVTVVWDQIHTNKTMSFNNSYDEAFVRRKGEKFAYNIGYIYGAGYKGIKKRVRAYFKDCPELIEMVNKNKIKKKNTYGIIKFYDLNCGE